MMDKIMIDKVREYIEEELDAHDMDSKKAVRVFIRTLRRVDLISRQEKLDLLCYANECWRQSQDAT